MSELKSVPLESQGKETIGEVTYRKIRSLSKAEKRYLGEYFTHAKKNNNKNEKIFYYVIPIFIFLCITFEYANNGVNIYSAIFYALVLLLVTYAGNRVIRNVKSLGLENPVIEMEGDFTYRSVSFSIIGSGLHIGGVSVGFPPGWGKAINFHQFTGHEVTAEVYATGNQRLILAIEGETYSGEHKRFTLEEALQSGQIEMEDAHP